LTGKELKINSSVNSLLMNERELTNLINISICLFTHFINFLSNFQNQFLFWIVSFGINCINFFWYWKTNRVGTNTLYTNIKYQKQITKLYEAQLDSDLSEIDFLLKII